MGHNFRAGDIVVAIGTDGFEKEAMAIGTRFRIIGEEDYWRYLILKREDSQPIGPYPQVTVFAWKFAPLPEWEARGKMVDKMVDPDFSLDEIEQAQELINGS